MAERIQQDIYQRQTWPTYQEMLVRLAIRSLWAAALYSGTDGAFPGLAKRQRANLPIASYRSSIMDTIENSQCVVLCGETGW